MVASTPRPSSGLAVRCTSPCASSRRICRVTRLGSDISASARSPIRAEPVGDLSSKSSNRTSTSVSLCDAVNPRFIVAYSRSAESRKFCHDLCSAMSNPGISLAVRPAIIPSMASC